jgi:pimeloyl-ACP methyl ester carboxylesterase
MTSLGSHGRRADALTRPLSFRVDEFELAATLFLPHGAPRRRHPAVCFVHGWTSDQRKYVGRATSLARLGITCLTFDLRGHGRSDGELHQFSREDHLRDVLAGLDTLGAQPGVDHRHLGLCGVSYGAYLASIATGLRSLRWLALRVPALYDDDEFASPTAQLLDRNPSAFARHDGLTTRNNRALSALGRYRGDVLLVQSGADEMIPEATYATYLRCIDQARLTHRVMEGADHAIFDEAMERRFIAMLSEWFAQRLGGEPERGT